MIVGLAKDGPAQRADLRTGDVLLSVAGSGSAIWPASTGGSGRSARPAIEVPFSIYRDGKTIETRIKTGDRNRFLKAPQPALSARHDRAGPTADAGAADASAYGIPVILLMRPLAENVMAAHRWNARVRPRTAAGGGARTGPGPCREQVHVITPTQRRARDRGQTLTAAMPGCGLASRLRSAPSAASACGRSSWRCRRCRPISAWRAAKRRCRSR